MENSGHLGSTEKGRRRKEKKDLKEMGAEKMRKGDEFEQEDLRMVGVSFRKIEIKLIWCWC